MIIKRSDFYLAREGWGFFTSPIIVIKHGETDMAKVTKVIDGYTFETVTGQEVRLLDVSVPDKGKSGAEATEELRKLIDGKNVNINPVGVMYGRMVAKVAVGRRSVNNAMNRYMNRTK